MRISRVQLAVLGAVVVAGAGIGVGESLAAGGGSIGHLATAANGWYSTTPGHQTEVRNAQDVYLVATGHRDSSNWEMDSARVDGDTWLVGELGGIRHTFFTGGTIGTTASARSVTPPV